jgi:hypothetical protein
MQTDHLIKDISLDGFAAGIEIYLGHSKMNKKVPVVELHPYSSPKKLSFHLVFSESAQTK